MNTAITFSGCYGRMWLANIMNQQKIVIRIEQIGIRSECHRRQCMIYHWFICFGFGGWGFGVGASIFCTGVFGQWPFVPRSSLSPRSGSYLLWRSRQQTTEDEHFASVYADQYVAQISREGIIYLTLCVMQALHDLQISNPLTTLPYPRCMRYSYIIDWLIVSSLKLLTPP